MRVDQIEFVWLYDSPVNISSLTDMSQHLRN